MSSSSMWLLDLDEEVSALRRASRRRVRVDAADQLSVFAAESHRRMSLSRDTRWDGGAWDADAWLLRDLPSVSSTHSLFARRNSGVRRLLDEVEPAATNAAQDEVYRQLRDRNRKLEATVTDVTEVNKRWQKHHSEREVYLQKLQTTIAELQQQSSVAKETNAVSKAEAGGGVTPERLAQSEAGNAQLRLELDAAHRKVQALEKEHQEHVHLLNFQVRSYRDDWEAERREKEQALKDKAALDEKCRKLEEQLAERNRPLPMETSVMNIAPCGCPCEPVVAPQVAPQHCPRNKTHHLSPTGSSTFRTSVHLPCGITNKNKVLKRRDTLDSSIDSSRASSPALSVSTGESGIVTVGFDDGKASLTSFSYPDTSRSVSSKSIEIGGCGAQHSAPEETTRVWMPPSVPGGAAEEGVLTQTRDTVVCPRCERLFAPDRHLDFLDHFEQCPAIGATSVAHLTLNNLN